ncbi:MAG: hypothetical protein KDA92_25985 [Planctomycetales bacterium]|nr:hypothetical protein [Planctomycetales bacterium]
MSAVSILEFTSTLRRTTEWATSTDNDWGLEAASADSRGMPDTEPATIPLKRSSSRVAEDVTAAMALLAMGVASVSFIGYFAANFYASMIQHGPFQIIRALGGLH